MITQWWNQPGERRIVQIRRMRVTDGRKCVPIADKRYKLGDHVDKIFGLI